MSTLRDEISRETDASNAQEDVSEGLDKEADWTEGYKSDEELHELRRQHKNTPDDDYRAKNKILTEFNGFMQKAIQPLKKSGTPLGALKSEVMGTMDRAIDRWDPDHESGAPLRNYVWKAVFPHGHTGYSVAHRAAKKYGDMKQVGGKRYGVITKARQKMEQFQEETGRAPSNTELGDMLSMQPDQVNKLRMEMSPVHWTDQMIDDDQDLGGKMSPRMRDAIKTVHASSAGPDQLLMQKMFYPLLGGAEPESDKQKDWADEIGMSPSQISRHKKKIERKIQQLL